MKVISRNAPCWCGSGRKYKSCHSAFDERLLVKKREGYPIPGRQLIKTREDIDKIKKSGEITNGLFTYLEDKVAAGALTEDLDRMVYEYTIKHGGIPAPLNYNGFPKSCCISINDVVCHGIPGSRRLENGDIVNIDLTTILDGYHADASRMYMIGDVDEAGRRLVQVAYECLMTGIKAVAPFKPINAIGEAVESYAVNNGYSVVRDLGGHGIGRDFHEDPFIFHFIANEPGMIMAPGMVFTIEPMINEKDYEVEVLEDDWTVMTVDGGRSAQWEHTILVTEKGAEILV